MPQPPRRPQKQFMEKSIEIRGVAELSRMGRTRRLASKIRIERPSNGFHAIDFHLPVTSPLCVRALAPRRSDRQVMVIERSPVVWVAYLFTKGGPPHRAIGLSAPAKMVDARRVWDFWWVRRGSSAGSISDSSPSSGSPSPHLMGIEVAPPRCAATTISACPATQATPISRIGAVGLGSLRFHRP